MSGLLLCPTFCCGLEGLWEGFTHDGDDVCLERGEDGDGEGLCCDIAGGDDETDPLCGAEVCDCRGWHGGAYLCMESVKVEVEVWVIGSCLLWVRRRVVFCA